MAIYTNQQLKPLAVVANNIDHLVTVQYSAGKPQILAIHSNTIKHQATPTHEGWGLQGVAGAAGTTGM